MEEKIQVLREGLVIHGAEIPGAFLLQQGVRLKQVITQREYTMFMLISVK